ncbi:MAG: hypothetical protein QOD00_4247, partial [Blastocatellia bacterium]|nr:hypothetical protein [Blastocatellia bacterium]
IQTAFRQTEESLIVGWLPLYHDMGLIGNILQALFAGTSCVFMSPMAFLQRPFRWLQAISHYRATTSGGPNFAYDLCVRKIKDEQRATLDLSSWSVAFNGAEPVRAETMERFASLFEPCGFRPQAFQPCYGLAEATLLVSASEPHKPLFKTVSKRSLERNLMAEPASSDEESLRLVSCGKALLDEKLLIVHPESLRRCGPGEVGEVWVSSPSVAGGYWNNAPETERTFGAYLSDTGDGPFLRTGDLGSLYEGELFLTGRLKDLIIIRGLNHYPQDIELSVERCHPSLRPGCGAAFHVRADGQEQLVIVQEVEPRLTADLSTIINSIREAVSEEHEVQAHDIVLLKAGTIPKTSSGKIQRRACRAMFLEESLEPVAEWHATLDSETEPGAASASETASLSSTSLPDALTIETADIENWLRAQLAAKLGTPVSQIDVREPMMRYGLDSLLAIELMHSLEERLNVALPMSCFLNNPSISEIAAQTLVQLNDPAAPAEPPPHPSSSEVNGEHQLSQGQQALWYLYQVAPTNAAYNIARAVRIRSALDVAALRRALQKLLDRHPALRTTFGVSQGDPVQRIQEHVEISFQEEDAATWSEQELLERLNKEAHRPFNLEHGPLLRVCLFHRSAEDHVLLLMVHHIVSDLWSLVLLVHELGIIYEAERAGQPAQIPPLKLDYVNYTRWQDEMLHSEEGQRHWEYWRERLEGELPVLNLPTDRPRPPVQTYQGASHYFKLSGELTERLKALSQERGVTLYTLLLAAFQVLLARQTGQDDIIVGSPTTGRSRSEFARVVGYFVNPVALRAHPKRNLTFTDFLDQVRESVLQAFEHQDYPFPLLVKRMQPERDRSRSPIFQTAFVWQKAHLSSEPGLSEFALGEGGSQIRLGNLNVESLALEWRAAQFDVTLIMAEAGGAITAAIEYNTDLFDAATIERFALHLQSLLRSISQDPLQPLSRLNLLSSDERHQLLHSFNHTHVP